MIVVNNDCYSIAKTFAQRKAAGLTFFLLLRAYFILLAIYNRVSDPLVARFESISSSSTSGSQEICALNSEPYIYFAIQSNFYSMASNCRHALLLTSSDTRKEESVLLFYYVTIKAAHLALPARLQLTRSGFNETNRQTRLDREEKEDQIGLDCKLWDASHSCSSVSVSASASASGET